MAYATRSFHREPGDPVLSFDLFVGAWDECVELQCSPRDEWVGRSLLAMQSMSRVEIGAFDGDRTVGGLLIAPDPWDVHVGPCYSVFTQYVLPQYRLQGVSNLLMREAIRVARKAGANVVAFTHRKGPWCYETLYRRLN